MKKPLLFCIFLIALLAACHVDSIPDDPNINPDNNPSHRTFLVFDNTHGICNVMVYNNPERTKDSFLAEIKAGQFSEEIDILPLTSMSVFFTYTVHIKGINAFSFDYVPALGKDQVFVNINANRKNTIRVPALDETVSSQDVFLTDKSYIFLQNNSSFAVSLYRGSITLSSDNLDDTLVNPGERSQYTVTENRNVSAYQLMSNALPYSFPDNLKSFDPGYVYNFIYDSDGIAFISEIEIRLSNIIISQNAVLPSAPSKPDVTFSDGRLTVRWQPVAGAEKYEVYISTNETQPSSPASVVFGTSAIISSLENKKLYYIWVKAVNDNGAGDFSPSAQGIPWSDSEKPEVPGGLLLMPGERQLSAVWENKGGASFYEVYISETQTRPSTPVITTNKTNAVITDLQNNIIYYIWLRATNTAGASDYSAFETGTPSVSIIPPLAPLAPVLTAGNRELIVSWQAVDYASSYEVWVNTFNNSSQAQKINDVSGSSTETVVTGLRNEITYFIWIRAVNSFGISGFSPSSFAVPSAFLSVPQRPSAPSVSAKNEKELDLTWTEIDGALSYEIWFSLDNNISNAQKYGQDHSTSSVTLTSLDDGKTYYIWIRSKNDKGTSDYSPMSSGTTIYTLPPSKINTAPLIVSDNGKLNISWEKTERAVSYEIRIGTSSNSDNSVKYGNDVEGLSVVISGLTNGTVYYIWIIAKNNVGTSGFSPIANGTPQEKNINGIVPSVPEISVGYGQLFLLWASVADATSYEVWYSTDNNSANAIKINDDILSVSSQKQNAVIGGLENGKLYYVWIKAKNSVSITGFSSVASGIPNFILTVTALNEMITLSWLAVPDAVYYDVYYSNNDTMPVTSAFTVNGFTRTITGLTNGTTYYFWVIPSNAYMEQGDTSIMASGIPIENIGPVSAVSGNGSLTVNWASVAGADQYDVYFNTINFIPANSLKTISLDSSAKAQSRRSGFKYC